VREMRTVLAVLAMVGLVFVAADRAAAQGAPSALKITIDENGNGTGTITDQTGVVTPFVLPAVVGPDPGPGGLPSVLQYQWPAAVLPPFVVGDLGLLEIVGTQPSDLVRFNNVGAVAPIFTIAFYSDVAESTFEIPDLADVGLPTANLTNLLILDEIGPEGGPNGLVYTPGPNNPGYVPGFQTTYEIISDVPEPGTMALLALGGLALIRRRRQ
jgi:hypothetical protein